MPLRQKLFSVLRPLALGLLLPPVLSQAAWSQCEAPLIRTEVRIEAPRLVQKFGGRRHQVAQDLAQNLAVRMARQFPYFCWAPDHSPASLPPKGRLVLSLVDKRGAVVMHFGPPRASPESWRDLPDLLLYGNRDAGADAATAQLQEDVNERLNDQLTDAYFKKLECLFIPTVVLAHQVEVKKDERRILIPFPESPLHAGQDSLLKIDFTPDSFVAVKKELACRKGRKVLRTIVHEIRDSRVLPEKRHAWDSRLPTWLEEGMKAQALNVFLQLRKPDNCDTDEATGTVQFHGAGMRAPACAVCARSAP